MRTYMITGEKQEDLENIVSNDEFSVTFRSKYLPIISLETEHELEEMREIFPGYTIEEAKVYHHDDRQQIGTNNKTTD